MLKFKLSKVTSTQDFAEAISSMLYEDFLVIAEEQTKARGRYKRAWYSPKGGLWFTYVKKNFNAEEIPVATLKASLAVRETLSSFFDAKIRWPNDVVVNDKKVSGILIEAIYAGDATDLFIGVGINTNVKEFPPDIKATSILLETGKEVNNDELLNNVISKMDYYLTLKEDFEEIVGKINNYLSIKDKKVVITRKDETKVECTALFVDKFGRLVTDCGIFEVEDVLRVESK
ncbi:biotin--acetyl-CoA-carboxylase ligase [Acidianus hospitalis W1]|uniref:Biotin--acetyl-CoA-carboxylase ligase n=1 Tax=Acidianus hospitalis (strain W1) TaxID=933801 RepID=F4B6M0_ACIHW|nr:biotin--[acetyl-CoA-carboxylase] ligase [Acidianus hospitalis]AEE93430.1 biotin--acetyl-CoA-carboxylase ligase [Acidianus hospitalis W1]